jgi:hypothetical protein
MAPTPETNSTDEIEITPRMKEIGAGAFYRGDLSFEFAEDIAAQIYREMETERRKAALTHPT